MVHERLRMIGALLALALPAIHLLRRIGPLHRQRSFSSPERVLILGASSGVGYATARQYARRGARVCVVARRADRINALEAECGHNCIAVAADLSVVEDMVKVRQTIENAWGGLDTIHVCAGVSALQPVMALTGVEEKEDAAGQGIQYAIDVAGKAVQGNFLGPLVAALVFVTHVLSRLHGSQTNMFPDPHADTYFGPSGHPPRFIYGRSCASTDTRSLRRHEGLLTPAIPITRYRTSRHSFQLHSSRNYRGRLPCIGCRRRPRSRVGPKQAWPEDRLRRRKMY